MLVPVVFYWWRNKKNIEPKLGLALGAVSGAGFGIGEGQWTLNSVVANLDRIFGSDWSWGKIQLFGTWRVFAGFWEAFFVIGISVAACALAGWGLAKGRGWQFYLLAALIFVIANYGPLLVSAKLMSPVQVEFLIAALALAVTGVALWLGERKAKS